MGEDYLAQPEPRTKQRRLRVWPLVSLILLVFFSFGTLGYYLAGLLAFVPVDVSLPGFGAAVEKMNILVIGSDQRKNEPSRADTLMLVMADANAPHVGVLSIPRDTYLNVPGHGETKVAHAHAYGGPDLAVQTVEAFLGVPVDHYLEINFEGFAAIVDTLGGIELDVERRMYYPEEGINLKAGRQRLNGKDALAFVRFRDYPEGDIERIRHQQRFLLALADEALSLKGILKSPRLLQELYTYVKTDLSLNEMLSLAKALRNLRPEQVSLALLPGEPRYLHGVSYWMADPAEVQTVLASLQQAPGGTEAQAKEKSR